ncbi:MULTISPECIES: endolytic transglycosylase MltG [Streptococcus]|uniref:Endolytic murein transglycosylase n=1 Tax=Streptococcus anginosus TaxID=1328 RepID=A0A4U9ZR87_STRAP|nr:MULTISPECIES: endolytic transglycosylase MltG [Streptococcus]VEE12934.1 aminodeoxychorismate lyase-like protein [Streptococcus milleri]VTS41691.1 aminodeoxychorismate lyase-like protein [Streptococcus anginosus]
MAEDSQEKEGLSFKEQILRDLAKAKGTEQPKPVEESNDLQEKLGLGQSVLPSAQEEEKTTASETDIPKVQKEESGEPEPAPLESPLPTVEQIEAETAAREEKEFNTHTTKVPVSYPTNQAVEESKAPEELVQPAVYGTEQDTKKLSRSNRTAQTINTKKRQNKIAGKIVKTVLILLLLGIGLTGFFAYRYVTSALQPVDAKNTKYVTVKIPTGSSTKAIGTVLEKAGLIKNAQIFSYYAKFNNYADFQSGYYNLQKSMSLDTIAKKLQQGGTDTPQDPSMEKLTIPEGYTIDQIAKTIAKLKKSKLSSDTFLKKVQDDNFITQEVAKYPNLLGNLAKKESGVKYRLEGYLFPATYNVTDSTTSETLIDQMLAAMDKTMSQYYDVLASKNLTVHDVLTIASLVEKEGSTDQDRKNIASVFYNRLNQNMPLQSNIAILYAQGKLGQKTTLAEDAAIDTNIDSPYNVYKNTGLMPGPVDNPSLSAIEATVNPAKTDYLYFVANTETGNVYFANTYEEHEKNVQEHVNSKLTQSSSSN